MRDTALQHLTLVWIPGPLVFGFSLVFKNYKPNPAETVGDFKDKPPDQEYPLICLFSFQAFEPIKCH